jgi:hypothetical protein
MLLETVAAKAIGVVGFGFARAIEHELVHQTAKESGASIAPAISHGTKMSISEQVP